MKRAVLIVALAALCGPALAQRSRAQTAPAPAPAPAHPAPVNNGANPQPAPAPVGTEPQRTTATFGDWVLTCLHPNGQPTVCQVAQTLAENGKPVAQTVFGRGRAGEAVPLNVVVPVNVSFAAQPRIVGPEAEANFAPISLAWRRCVPAGCVAEAMLSDEQMQRLRSRTENARVLFQDSSGREAVMPFSPRGLSQALDALAKEG